MKTYPLIESLGLEIQITSDGEIHHIQHSSDGRHARIVKNQYFTVDANELEKVLQAGKLLKGNPNDGWGNADWDLFDGTHTCFAIDLKPIEKPKPVSKLEIDLMVTGPCNDAVKFRQLLQRIHDHGVES